MNIVKPYAKLIKINGVDPQLTLHSAPAGIQALKWIEWCGRISHRSEDAQMESSYERFIRAVVLGHGDWSIVEQASATVDFLVDRGITHEIVRHRLFSFTQESTRFVNYEKKMPASFIRPLPELIGDATEVYNSPAEIAEDAWLCAMQQAEDSYKVMIANGCAPQIARSVFPNALASRLIMTGNLRNWRHFFIMRCTKEAHPQMREVTIPLLAEFQRCIPILFEDLEPEMKQSEAMKRAR